MKINSDFHWLVGFLEGEGSFGCYRKNAVSITIGQVQREPLDRALRIFGSGKIYTYQVKNPNAKPLNYLKVVGVDAAGWMMVLYSFMSTRRKEQIKKALSTWKHRKNTQNNSYYLRAA